MLSKVLVPLFLFFSWQFQSEPVVAILEPLPGAAIQGSVTIIAATALEDFALAELSFQYSDGDTEAWFPLATLDRPVQAEPVAVWDTTKITDGDYRLRLRVHRTDGSYQDSLVESLRVRNYSTVETSTPTTSPTEGLEATVQKTRVPTAVTTPTVAAVLESAGTPTRMPENSASIQPGDILSFALRGALFVLAGFGVFGVYLWIRSGIQGG